MSDIRKPRLLLKTRPDIGVALSQRSFTFGDAAFEIVHPLFENEPVGNTFAAAASSRWYVAEAGPETISAAELWDLAYATVGGRGIGLADVEGAIYAEPDLPYTWLYENDAPVIGEFGAAPGELCAYHDQREEPLAKGPCFAWHLGDGFSQLKQARDEVQKLGPANVRIAILDVGFDFHHQASPAKVLLQLQRNFVNDDRPRDDASDPFLRGTIRNPGHGTGALGLLAGKILEGMARPEQNTGDYLGGTPLAEIIPVRIASSVMLLYTSACAQALDYVLAPNGDARMRADVVSMSMGGLASCAWTDVVNRAYEAGVCVAAAAGNNRGVAPKRIVYPARYHRVIAALGVMANHEKYADLPNGILQGNYGPDSKMDTAMAAYTPNMPWAEINCEKLIDMTGSGTSCATPQIAAAAALWLQKYKKDLTYSEPWMVVEAVRNALFSTAYNSGPESRKYFGRGILRAANALHVRPAANLTRTNPDSASFAFLRVLTGLGMVPPAQNSMLQIEAAQLMQRYGEIEDTIDDPDLAPEEVPRNQVKNFFDAVLGSPDASKALKAHAERQYMARFKQNVSSGGSLLGPSTDSPGALPMLPEKFARKEEERPINEIATQKPVHRRLKCYAFDPSLSTQLETALINQAVFEVPWEENLKKGPVGEYLEVIDYDPASRCFYAPVDLNDPRLLATDGLEASEGNPEFHQQMVYAVAMRTIANFERALGRKAIWASRMKPNDSVYVQRLRIFPHAIRQPNAYYSPDKKALLFGYFPASNAEPGRHYPGGTVFTCLSHDIVAHETTHALLDGMHRSFSQPTNPDMLAFHEAFADIVALFQHFSMPEVLRHQVAKTRGDLTARSVLGELAQEFGEATGQYGALRSAIGRVDPTTGKWELLSPDPIAYQMEMEPHKRGAILVAAIFDAFLSIYHARVGDLLRIATSGTGVLPEGAIHPDLASRLSVEAAKSAQHVLTMCIRALDYCPPVDLTFGDFLRALITADFDIVPNDTRGYRVAFVEAFRRRGLYPRDVRTLSVDSLRWQEAAQFGSENLLESIVKRLRKWAHEQQYLESREDIFIKTRKQRIKLHGDLVELCNSKGARLGAALGIDLQTNGVSFEIHSLRQALKVGPDGSTWPQLIIEITQERKAWIEEDGSSRPARSFPFTGGCTIIADQRTCKVRYHILKNVLSDTRLQRQRQYYLTRDRSLEALYFHSGSFAHVAEPFALLHRLHAAGEDTYG